MKHNRFIVIIPVTIRTDLARKLLKSIADNTLLPQKVVIVDNTAHGFEPGSFPFPITILQDGLRHSCNESWNIGMSHVSWFKDCDFVTVLNDDLLLNPWFFEKIADVFFMGNGETPLGCVCPQVENEKYYLERNIQGEHKMVGMKKREGGAFTLAYDLLAIIPPIPPELQVYYGDDWIWWWTYRAGRKCWIKDEANIIWHAGTATYLSIYDRSELYETFHRERVDFCRIKLEAVHARPELRK